MRSKQILSFVMTLLVAVGLTGSGIVLGFGALNDSVTDDSTAVAAAPAAGQAQESAAPQQIAVEAPTPEAERTRQPVLANPEPAPPAVLQVAQAEIPPPAPPPAANELHPMAPIPYAIRLSGDGLLPGRFNKIGRGGAIELAHNVVVSFVRNGRIVTQAEPGESGVFQAAGLKSGRYSVIAADNDGIAVFGIYVLPHDENAVPAGGLQIDSIMMLPQDAVVLSRLLQAFVGSPAAMSQTAPAKRGAKIELVRHLQDNEAAAKNSLHRLKLTLIGNQLSGKLVKLSELGIAQPANGLHVHLIRDGQISARTPVNNDGMFVVNGVEPGVYSLVALGSDGLTAFGLEVNAAIGVLQHQREIEENHTTAAERNSGLQFVSFLQGGGNGDLTSAVIPLEDLALLLQLLNLTPEELEQLLGGGGVGGGVGGNLGLLGLLGLLDDDDEFASPFRPLR